MGYVPIEGELVRVRLWDDMKNEFGTDYDGDINCRICFSSGMRKFCGREFIVTDVVQSYHDDLYKIGGLTREYTITSEMIEPASITETYETQEIDNFLDTWK